MIIAIASEHAGFEYKERIKQYLVGKGHEVRDLGTNSTESVDYPDFIRPAAIAVSEGQCERGIVLGGSGNGEAISANRIHGIRCALCWSVETAKLARLHNNANMISIGARLTEWSTVEQILETWLTTDFEGGRHIRRIEKIDS